MLTPDQFSLLRHAAIVLSAWLAFLLLAYWAPPPVTQGGVAAGAAAGVQGLTVARGD